ncbi:MAG: anaerobic ribonucleoside-triphosphate reductase activating protein [Candidatus Borkfalkia sp.]
MMISGLQKLTLLDFPQKVACTVFLGGCNLRCPFCQNGEILDGRTAGMTEDDFFAFLKKRQKILDGVCVSGGEPLLHEGIFSFIEKIRALGYAVKLDTNGTFPVRLKRLVQEKLIDYVAMDIKNSPKICADGGDGSRSENIRESATFLMESTSTTNSARPSLQSITARRISSSSESGCAAQRSIFCKTSSTPNLFSKRG